MASSRPASFQLDDDDDWGNISPLPSSTSHPSSTLSAVSSGEFNAFTSAGIAVAGGGGPKRELWVWEESNLPCLGKVGTHNKFCIKARLEGLLHCGTGRHSSKFQALKGKGYIRVTDNLAYSLPTLDLDQFSAAQQEKILRWSFQASDWETDIKAIAKGDFPEWFSEIVDQDDVASAKDEQDSVELLSPMSLRWLLRLSMECLS
jgi:hypothetical protein